MRTFLRAQTRPVTRRVSFVSHGPSRHGVSASALDGSGCSHLIRRSVAACSHASAHCSLDRFSAIPFRGAYCLTKLEKPEWQKDSKGGLTSGKLTPPMSTETLDRGAGRVCPGLLLCVHTSTSTLLHLDQAPNMIRGRQTRTILPSCLDRQVRKKLHRHSPTQQ